MRWNSPSAQASSVPTWGGPSGVTIVTDHVTELPSAREISLTTSFGGGSPGGRVDCARFQCHRPTNGLLSAHAAPAASATQRPMITVVPRIRVICVLLLSCDDHRRPVRDRRQRFAQKSVDRLSPVSRAATSLAVGVYATTGRRPYASINFVTAHDGFTLR